MCGRPCDRVFKTRAICHDCDGRAMASQVNSLACLASRVWCVASARGIRPVAFHPSIHPHRCAASRAVPVRRPRP
jgi:hypothetical protein